MSGWDEGAVYYSDQAAFPRDGTTAGDNLDASAAPRRSVLRKFKGFIRGFQTTTNTFPYRESLVENPKFLAIDLEDLDAFDNDLPSLSRSSPADYLPLFKTTAAEVSGELEVKSAGRNGESYPDHSPSILPDAWLAVQGPKNLCIGSTREWRSRNYSAGVSEEESSRALQELLPKASAVYPKMKDWTFKGARAGVHAMPPNTTLGSLPLLGCIDDLVSGKPS